MKRDLIREAWGKVPWSAVHAGPSVCVHQCLTRGWPQHASRARGHCICYLCLPFLSLSLCKAVEVSLRCNRNLLNQIHPWHGPGCKLTFTVPGRLMWMFSFIQPACFRSPCNFHIHLYEGIGKVNTRKHWMEGNNAMFHWRSVPRCSRDSFKNTCIPLMFGSALLGDCLTLCLLFFVLFSTLIIFAHADWMKNWGKHQKQLSKTWFSFCSWCDVGLHFRHELGEPACLVWYFCILVIMLHFKSSFAPG